jgi:hypothetical protein
MSGIAITIVVTSLVCAGIALVVFVQAREKARIEKVRKLSLYSERHRNIQRLLAELPPQYLNNPMRIMLSEQSILCLQQLNQLKPSPRNSSYIEEDQTRINTIKAENPKFPAVKIDDEGKAREARNLLQVFYKLLHIWLRHKQLPADQAKLYMEHVAFLARQSKADLHVARAQSAEGIGKPRVAIHNYHSAIEILKDVMQHPQAASAVEKYREKMKQLKTIADQNNEKVKTAAQAKLDESDEWSDLIPKEDDWKKKNNYDD